MFSSPTEYLKSSSTTIQFTHDTECHYRNKDCNKINSYSKSVTEKYDQPDDDQKPVLNQGKQPRLNN